MVKHAKVTAGSIAALLIPFVELGSPCGIIAFLAGALPDLPPNVVPFVMLVLHPPQYQLAGVA